MMQPGVHKKEAYNRSKENKASLSAYHQFNPVSATVTPYADRYWPNGGTTGMGSLLGLIQPSFQNFVGITSSVVSDQQRDQL